MILTFGKLKVASGKVNGYAVGGFGKTNLEALEEMFKEIYLLQKEDLI